MELAHGDESRVSAALLTISQAIDTYDRRRRDLSSTAEARGELASLAKSLRKANAALNALSVSATAQFLQAHTGTLGRLKRTLTGASSAAKAASTALPNKRSNLELGYLAYGAAKAMRDDLNVEPKLTRDFDENITAERGGGGYARVARAVLRSVGVQVNNPRRYMEVGIALLREFDEPERTESGTNLTCF